MENKTTYIHETHTLYADNGELYMHFRKTTDDEDTILIFNIDTLYNDLTSIVRLCIKDKKKRNKLMALEFKNLFQNELKNTLYDL